MTGFFFILLYFHGESYIRSVSSDYGIGFAAHVLHLLSTLNFSVHVVGTYNDVEFYNKDVTFVIGEGSEVYGFFLFLPWK